MKVALLILGCTVRSPDMELKLFGIVVVGLRITWYTFDIFAANSATSHCFDGLACFHLDTRDGPFGYDNSVRISRLTVDAIRHERWQHLPSVDIFQNAHLKGDTRCLNWG